MTSAAGGRRIASWRKEPSVLFWSGSAHISRASVWCRVQRTEDDQAEVWRSWRALQSSFSASSQPAGSLLQLGGCCCCRVAIGFKRWEKEKGKHPVLIMFMPERRLPSACRIPRYVAAIFWQLPSIAHVLTLIVVSSAPRLCTSQVRRCESSPLFYYSGEAIVGQRLAVSLDRWSCSRLGKALISLSLKEPQSSRFALFAPTELKPISETFLHTTTLWPPSYCHKLWLQTTNYLLITYQQEKKCWSSIEQSNSPHPSLD